MMKPNQKLLNALDVAGFSNLQCVADLGYVGWRPPTNGMRYTKLAKATAAKIQAYTVSNETPGEVVNETSIALPLTFSTSIPKQMVALKFPYGQIAVAPLYHAFQQIDKASISFYFGCSALHVLGRQATSRSRAPYLATKVPGTNIIMLHYFLDFGQDYSVPGFQFERLMLGKKTTDRHELGFTEHVQVMDIGGHRVLMTAEVDGMDTDGNPVEIKLIKKGRGGSKVVFQMIGSGSLTLIRGKNDKGVLNSVESIGLETIAQSLATSNDVSLLEANIIRGMETLKQFDRNGYFEGGKVYKVKFSPKMELHLINGQNPLLPPASVLKELF